MSNDLPEFTNRSLAIILVVYAVSWSIVLTLVWLIFQPPTDTFVASAIGAIVFISIFMGFAVYRQRFRDERTLTILEKSGRNGFFVLIIYLIPPAIIYYSLNEATQGVALVLLVLWFLAVAITFFSAVYYYYRD